MALSPMEKKAILAVYITDQNGQLEILKNVNRQLYHFWLQTVLDVDYPEEFGVNIEDYYEWMYVSLTPLASAAAIT
jgi:hypothetical protein